MRKLAGFLGLGLIFCLSARAAWAGDTERQLVFRCYNQGMSTVAEFRQCTGLTGGLNDFRGCLGSNSCFDGAPGGAIPAAQLGIRCAQQANRDIAQFARCTGGAVILPGRDQVLIHCAENSSEGTVMEFAKCAAPTAGIKLSDDQQAAIDCAQKSEGDRDDFLNCVGNVAVGAHLNTTQRELLTCASQSHGEAETFADCSAEKLFDANATPEERIAVKCAVQSNGDVEQFGACAGTAYMGLRLNPEQQIAVECVVGTGGQLYATAGCIATRLTGRELEKCVANGFGGDGCFGDSNDLFGYKGWTARTLKTLAGGPNSVFNSPQQIWGGPNSVVRNPGQVFGGPNSVFNNPGQILGGPNSVFHQAAPNPIQVGSVGGHRICVPWC
jgi:hypothetical protein